MKRVLPIIIGISILMFSASSVFGQMTAQDHYKRAEDYFKQGRYNEAIAPLKEAIRIKPNYADAHYNLGAMYAEGKGVLQDYALAHMWFNLSGPDGSKVSVRNRNRLEKLMTPSQIEKAQRLAREWLESHKNGEFNGI